MDRVIAPLRSRIEERNRRQSPYTLTEKAQDRRANPYEATDPADEPLHRRRTIMTNSHRRFHRRAAQAGSNIKTVNVEVVATVDTAGNVVAQTTVTQPDSTAPTDVTQPLPVTDVSAPASVPTAVLAANPPSIVSVAPLPAETIPAVPSTPAKATVPVVPSVLAEPTVSFALPVVPAVPAVPSVALPSVPAVPPFPSDLTVPAYPYGSGASVASSVTASSSASSAASSSEPVMVAALTVKSSATSSSASRTSSIASSTTLQTTMGGFTFSPHSVVMVASTAVSSEASASAASRSTTPTTEASARATPTQSLDAAGSASYYGIGGAGWNGDSGSTTAGLPAGTNPAAVDDSKLPTTPLDTPQVVGSVVGSLAGAALILAIILMLLRRHKRRQGGALQLTDSHPSQSTDHEQAMRQVQPPPQLPPRASLVPSLTFLHRFSGMSRSTADTSSPTERSFQRVSGRKLPSAFSEGMTSDQFARASNITDSSFYQDDHGTYGGSGSMNKEYGGSFGKEIGDSSFAAGAGKMNVRPSPARTPVITHPNDANPFDDANRTLSPPMSPNPFSSPLDLSPRAALGRSLHSADGSRSSRFTENV
ncbi:hypothetical protein E8E13_002595 [Curvularia kusanoi]|uniref:Uncharacterized protein n=1 Tax=Curvularia kusanoi TaxID=90978 RepID=A0A9P4W409_CURKU|nr:hypothetical protein E8E13_002595 [Curvularia kusanoi]